MFNIRKVAPKPRQTTKLRDVTHGLQLNTMSVEQNTLQKSEHSDFFQFVALYNVALCRD